MRKRKIALYATATIVLYGLMGVYHHAYSATQTLGRDVATEMVAPLWSTRIAYDVGKKRHVVSTVASSVAPITPLSKPYEKLRSWVGLNCDGEKYWPFIGFTVAPIEVQTNDSTELQDIYAQVTWGDISRYVRLRQESRDPRFFVFADASYIMERMLNTKAMSVNIVLYDSQSARFEYSLKGIKSASDEMETECAKIAPNMN